MPKKYFTMNLDVTGKRCLVVGGDDEALEKTERLLDANAQVVLVAKRVALPALAELIKANPDTIEFHERAVEASDVEGCFFVLNAVKTDPPVSKMLWDETRKHKILISSYDQGEYCDAVMQALVMAGPMRIAIGTGGSSPVLASSLRRELEGLLCNDAYTDYVAWVVSQRQALIDQGVGASERKETLKKMVADFKIAGEINYPRAYREKA
jgi:precorrin-2 dehydrogenase/sirohydrochlorin ferrochelatase